MCRRGSRHSDVWDSPFIEAELQPFPAVCAAVKGGAAAGHAEGRLTRPLSAPPLTARSARSRSSTRRSAASTSTWALAPPQLSATHPPPRALLVSCATAVGEGKQEDVVWETETLTRHWLAIENDMDRLVRLYRLLRVYSRLKTLDREESVADVFRRKLDKYCLPGDAYDTAFRSCWSNWSLSKQPSKEQLLEALKTDSAAFPTVPAALEDDMKSASVYLTDVERWAKELVATTDRHISALQAAARSDECGTEENFFKDRKSIQTPLKDQLADLHAAWDEKCHQVLVGVQPAQAVLACRLTAFKDSRVGSVYQLEWQQEQWRQAYDCLRCEKLIQTPEATRELELRLVCPPRHTAPTSHCACTQPCALTLCPSAVMWPRLCLCDGTLFSFPTGCPSPA